MTFFDTRIYEKKFVTFFDTRKYKCAGISRHGKIQTAAHFSTRGITKKLCDISRHAKIRNVAIFRHVHLQTAAHFSTRGITNRFSAPTWQITTSFCDTRKYNIFFRADVSNNDFISRHVELPNIFRVNVANYDFVSRHAFLQTPLSSIMGVNRK